MFKHTRVRIIGIYKKNLELPTPREKTLQTNTVIHQNKETLHRGVSDTATPLPQHAQTLFLGQGCSVPRAYFAQKLELQIDEPSADLQDRGGCTEPLTRSCSRSSHHSPGHATHTHTVGPPWCRHLSPVHTTGCAILKDTTSAAPCLICEASQSCHATHSVTFVKHIRHVSYPTLGQQ